jgi:hypothetical protein
MGTQWNQHPDPRYSTCSGACGGDRDCSGCAHLTLTEELALLLTLLGVVVAAVVAVAMVLL